MSCSFCKDRSVCKKICKSVEKLLPKPRSGGHRKEFPTNKIERIYQWSKEKETGLRKKPVVYGADYEMGIDS